MLDRTLLGNPQQKGRAVMKSKQFNLSLIEYDNDVSYVTMRIVERDIEMQTEQTMYQMQLKIPQSIWPMESTVQQHAATMALFNAWQEINTEISCPHNDKAVCVLRAEVISEPAQPVSLNPQP
jgi:hypothetical protein